ncbi:hypothetical protein ACLOJK_032347 [Asimina triloba]
MEVLRCQGKTAWPELLGARAEMAKEIIERENKWVKVVFMVEGFERTMDYRCDRVFLWTAEYRTGVVVRVPTVG